MMTRTIIAAFAAAAITCASAAQADPKEAPCKQTEIGAYPVEANNGDLAVVFHFLPNMGKGKRMLIAAAEVTYTRASDSGPAAQHGFWVGGNGREASSDRRTISHKGLTVMKHWTSTVARGGFTELNGLEVKEQPEDMCNLHYSWFNPQDETGKLCMDSIAISCQMQGREKHDDQLR